MIKQKDLKLLIINSRANYTRCDKVKREKI